MVFNEKRYALIAIFVGLCTLIAPRDALSQVTFSGLSGVVSDASGAVVSNSKLTITAIETGTTRTAVTDARAKFLVVLDLNPGTYNIAVDAPGFNKTILSNIKLYVGQTSTQDIRLDVGAVQETVSVSSEAPLLNTTNGQVGTVIVQKIIDDLPLNGKDFLQLNLLLPGARHDNNLVTANIVDINPANTTYSVNGQKGDDNTYLLDGTIVKDYQHGTAPIAPSVDAIQEFQTTTSNYSAAFGVEAAAPVNLLTKSGTNVLHGTAWEYLRNNKLYNGENKSFFFFNYEGFRQRQKRPHTGQLSISIRQRAA